MLPKMISRRLFNAALPLAISATSIDRISIGAVSSPWIPADATTLCSTSPSAPCGSKRTMPSPSQAHFTPVGNLPSVSAGFFPSMTKSRKFANMAGSALEIIDGTQLQNASQCVERSTRFIEQFQIGKIARCDAVTIVRVDPGIELREERVVHPDARIHCNTLCFLQHHTQSQACRTAAVLHAFAQIEDEHVVDGSRTCVQGIEIFRNTRVLTAFLRHHEHLPAIGPCEQRAVKQIGDPRLSH